MSANKNFLQAAGLLVMWLGAAHFAAATPIFTVTPSPTVSGLPGDLIGWDFTITNDSNFIEISSAQFCVLPLNLPSCTQSTLGSFTDYISGFNDIVVGPAGTVSQSFDPLAQTGVGSFSISNSAPIFATDFGVLVLTYNVFDADPNDPNGANQLNNQDLYLTTNANVFVQSPIPEPSTYGVAGVLLAMLAFHKRMFRK